MYLTKWRHVMKKITLAASLLIAPALVQAQSSVQAQSQANVNASAAASSPKGTTSAQGGTSMSSSATTARSGAHRLSADAQSKVDANIRVARERKLPEEPIRQRAAEGEAKGASDAQIVAASSRTLVELQSSFDAMVRGGHASPSDAETSRGASLLARGYTSVQLEGIARKAPSDRSLVTAFDVLTSLQARGASTATAVAQLESQLAARASDAQLRSLAANVEATAGVSGALNGARTGGSATGSAAGSTAMSGAAGSAAAGAGAAAAGALGSAANGAGAKGGVAGAVSGVLGKP